MDTGSNGSYDRNISSTSLLLPQVTTSLSTSPQTVIIDDTERIEFYKTYDVMTGIRIAATLGGFFGLMVILVLVKSKSKTERALEDPIFTAAAVAQVEEEDEREMDAALEAVVYEHCNYHNKIRRSLDISSAPPDWHRSNSGRCSIAGYNSLLERGGSRLPSFADEAEEDPEDICLSRQVDVPRRLSSITCCSSSASSYLEQFESKYSRSNDYLRTDHTVYVDDKFPIDIRIIQPTPRGSPCDSDRTIQQPKEEQRPIENGGRKSEGGLNFAPLASISSFNSSVETDAQSYNSDSVFFGGTEDDENDTDEDIKELSISEDSGNNVQRLNAIATANEENVSNNSNNNNSSSTLQVLSKSLSTGSKMSFVLFDQGQQTLDDCPLDERSWPQETLF